MDNATDKPLLLACPGCHAELDASGVPAFTEVYCPQCGRRLTVPQPFANVLVQELIGSSPTGSVYRAIDPTLRREVAFRVAADHLSQRRDYVAVFLDQARRNSALANPAVLPVYDCGEWQGHAYITTQFMPDFGMDAHWGTPTEPLDLEFCLEIMTTVATAMELAWQHGVLHHNLSPRNILFDDDMHVKVADFGLAYAAWNPAATPAENLQATCTTGIYISPEKGLTGKQDGRGDIYSMGAIFYHWLTGQAPFPDSLKTEEFGRRVMEPLPPPRTIRHDLPETLNALILQMMAVSPERRPQTCKAVLEQLTAVRRSLDQKNNTLSRRLSLSPSLRRAMSPRPATPPPPAAGRRPITIQRRRLRIPGRDS